MFILIEKTMSGTVTLQTFPTGYDFKNFKNAVDIIKKSLKSFGTVTILEDNENEFAYTIEDSWECTRTDEPGMSIPTYGRIENRPLQIIKDKIKRKND